MFLEKIWKRGPLYESIIQKIACRFALGNAVKLTAKATGGKTAYTYAFYFKRSSNLIWKTLGTEWGTASTAKVVPTSAGYYDFRVLVKDATGRAVTKTFKVTVKEDTGLKNNSTISATNVASGTAVKVTGKASGGSSPYKYAFYYKRSTSDSWMTMGTAYGTATTGSFTPKSAGTFNVKVSVRRSSDAEGSLRLVSLASQAIRGSECRLPARSVLLPSAEVSTGPMSLT